jgi:hypothetical protein
MLVFAVHHSFALVEPEIGATREAANGPTGRLERFKKAPADVA